MLAKLVGMGLVRISPLRHKTAPVPLDKAEQDELDKAVYMVLKRRLPVLVSDDADLFALAIAIGPVLLKREAIASLQAEARANAAKANDTKGDA